MTVAAWCASACGAPMQEQEVIEQSDPLAPIEARQIVERGVALMQQGDYVRAEQYFNAAMDKGYPEDELMPLLLDVCVRGSRLVAALGYGEPYLARNPQKWSLRVLIGSIHMSLGHGRDASRELERAIADAPEEPPSAHYLLAVLYRQGGDLTRSRGHFARYLSLEPDGPHGEEARAEVDRIDAQGTAPDPVAPVAGPPTAEGDARPSPTHPDEDGRGEDSSPSPPGEGRGPFRVHRLPVRPGASQGHDGEPIQRVGEGSEPL